MTTDEEIIKIFKKQERESGLIASKIPCFIEACMQKAREDERVRFRTWVEKRKMTTDKIIWFSKLWASYFQEELRNTEEKKK